MSPAHSLTEEVEHETERYNGCVNGRETQGWASRKGKGAVVCETLMCGGAGMCGIPGHISSVQDETSTGAE